MSISRRQILAVAALSAIPASAQASCIPDSDSVVTNGTSGLVILQNAEDDYSLKMVSGDGSKNVTYIRYKGTTALADVQRAYRLQQALLELFGLDA